MTKVNWRKFPESKPKKKGKYLVTVFDSEDQTVKPRVIVARWRKKTGQFWGVPDWNILAWMEFPAPYEPPEPEDMHPDAITARNYMEGDPETLKRLGIFD